MKFGLILSLIVIVSACDKDVIKTNSSDIERLQIWEEDEVKWAMGAVAGEDVVLLVYVDNANLYNFKLIDNDGLEIWTKTFGYVYSVKSNGQIPDMKIIHDSDSSFAIFYDYGLKKVDYNGSVIYDKNTFIDRNRFRRLVISNVVLGMNNEYMIVGSQGVGTFAFSIFLRYDKDGLLLGSPISQQRQAQIERNTDVIPYKGSSVLIGNTGTSFSSSDSNYLTVTKFDPNGNQQVQIFHSSIPDGNYLGRELIKISEGNYGYLLSPIDNRSGDKRSRLYHFNDSGEITGMTYLDLAPLNVGAGNTSYIGKGLVKNGKNGFTGLMKMDVEISKEGSSSRPGTYNKAHYSYYYDLNESAELIRSEYITRTYSNYFNGIVKMSNNQLLLFGTTLSLGEYRKLTTTIR
ncbi:MAG: hypothetical protein ACI8SE_001642 [Bacteroidia bacterium]|jgi:hypothetical protein